MNIHPKTPPSANHQRDLFLAVLEISDPVERAAFLESACGNDRELRARVEELLAEQQQLGDFLDVPALATAPELSPVSKISGGGAGVRLIAEKVGDQIGRYKLLQIIGEGGYGSVYMAEQQEPVRRRVASKTNSKANQ
jgi:hypothetical protein